jgi:hypothetical protein
MRRRITVREEHVIIKAFPGFRRVLAAGKTLLVEMPYLISGEVARHLRPVVEYLSR